MTFVGAGDAWCELVVRSLTEEGLHSPHGDRLPGFPPVELQLNTTGLEGAAAVRHAHRFTEDVRRAVFADGCVLGPASTVLDFGIGWGRIARMMLHDTRLDHLHGIDVEADSVRICRSLGLPNVETCAALPPTAFASGSVDLVVAYSVFSHLSEHAFIAWLGEFARLLRPGGHLAFTSRHESFLDYCAMLAERHDQRGYGRALATLFPDVQAARDQYRAGRFVHATSPGVSGGGSRSEDFYGESLIPRAYVDTVLDDRWTLVADAYDGARYDQICYVLGRRAPLPSETRRP